MKIKEVRISGFRGIPPVSPDVDINLEKKGEIKDLLLFGPNAYGKSSIADALEWFFKEDVRGRAYFADYGAENNVHLNLGSPGAESTAFVELVIHHQGQDFAVRKELDSDGNKANEILAGMENLLGQAQDEIIVLDHDQFRNFVAAANKEKWETFASLIGFELLDNFRGGLDSLTQTSLTSNLNLKQLETRTNAKAAEFTRRLSQAAAEFACPGESLSDLREQFRTTTETRLASLGLPHIGFDAFSVEKWREIEDQVETPDAIVKAVKRREQLKTQAKSLSSFPKDFIQKLDELRASLISLAEKKQAFDKEVLSEFYRTGLRIIELESIEQDHCPFCSQPIDWSDLGDAVRAKITDLNFEGIKRQHEQIKALWDEVIQTLRTRGGNFVNSEYPEIAAAFEPVSEFSGVDKALSLEHFDEDVVVTWIDNVKTLVRIVEQKHQAVTKELAEVRESNENPLAETQQAVRKLRLFWQTLVDLQRIKQEKDSLEKELQYTKEIIDGLRDVSRAFRSELSDFSGRVAEKINQDVQCYYKELHPHDEVVPALEVSVDGNQRKVALKCTFRGIENRMAAPLLSESHRNSLGMAIFLAFIKFKRQHGCPIEFIIFDDVTQSFDVEHRTNLLSLLENPKYQEIYDQQIFFLTHDRTLADLVKRPGDQGYHKNWLRYDIQNCWWEHMVLESETKQVPLNRADYYVQKGDAIAAAIYARRGLEKIYKAIIQSAGIKVRYTEKPWKMNMEQLRTYIWKEINDLWSSNQGFLNPFDNNLKILFLSQRILNFCVHDSAFLDNPMTLGDVKNALAQVKTFETRFKCSCGAWFRTLEKDPQGKLPVCNAKKSSGERCSLQLR